MGSSSTNWLSFSLCPMDIINSSTSSAEASHLQQLVPFDDISAHNSQLLFDNFYAKVWEDQKPQEFCIQGQQEGMQGKDVVQIQENMTDNNSLMMMNRFMNIQAAESQYQNQAVPKLEDFLGGGDSTIHKDSYMTQIYDIKALTESHAFSTNSGLEVDGSGSMGNTQLSTELADASMTELAFSKCPTGALSLGVVDKSQNCSEPSEKSIVPVETDYTKMVAADTFGHRTSIYRGVTRHRWTGRYEAHLWDNNCRREGQARKGRQVYLGGYDKEEKAARAYDLAALKYWGSNATTNFPISDYIQEVEEMKNMSKQEFIASLRRKSTGFSRGASVYRGVTRHHQQGRWQARIGRVAGNKDLYLGTFATQEEAAEAYDIAAIKFRGVNAVTNFEMNRYNVEAIMTSPLPIGRSSKRQKMFSESEEKLFVHRGEQPLTIKDNTVNFAGAQHTSSVPCSFLFNGAGLYNQNPLPQFEPTNISNSTPLASTLSIPIPTPIPAMPQPPEFFLWPHQSYFV